MARVIGTILGDSDLFFGIPFVYFDLYILPRSLLIGQRDFHLIVEIRLIGIGNRCQLGL